MAAASCHQGSRMVLHGTRNTAMSKDLLGLCGWSNGDFAVFHTMIATCLCVFVVSVYSRCTCYARLSSPPVDESRVSSYNQGKNADRRWVPVHRLHEFYKMSLQKDSRSDYLSSNEQLDSLGEFKWATWFGPFHQPRSETAVCLLAMLGQPTTPQPTSADTTHIKDGSQKAPIASQ